MVFTDACRDNHHADCRHALCECPGHKRDAQGFAQSEDPDDQPIPYVLTDRGRAAIAS